MTITSDNSVLEVLVLFDISGVNPVINLTNQSTGDPDQSPMPVLSNLVWALNVYSPTGTPIYTSDFDTPFQTGVWTTASITSAWPRPFGQIEWSGADYRVEFQIRDNNTGTIYLLNKNGAICRPVGNTKKSTDTYGQVNLSVETLCERASLYIADNTSKTYKGITGTNISSYLVVDYPRDPTGTLPAPFVITSFVTDALVPFTYNAEGFKATYFTIYQYDLGDNVFLKIRYVAQQIFAIQCNANLCIIDCQLQGLINEIESGTCDDIQAAKDKLSTIGAKAHQVGIGIKNPSCGIDVNGLIDEIAALGGYDCECAGADTGIGSPSVLVDGVLFDVVSEGGDVAGHFEQVDNNITLYISDKSYSFSICSDTDTEAFEFRRSTNSSNVSICLYIKKSTLAQELLTTIKTDVSLANYFNSIVTFGAGFLVAVNGKCVFTSSPTSDYTWSLENIPSNPSYALLSSITNAGLPVAINFLFNENNPTALQTYLNTLGLGTFVVTAGVSGNLTIESDTNINNLSNLTYNTGSGLVIASQATINSGVQTFTPNQVFQYILDYLCVMDDSKIVTSQEYEICYVDIDGVKQTEIIAAGETLATFLEAIRSLNCTTIDYIVTLASPSCDNMKLAFPVSDNPFVSTDYVLGTKSGACARIGSLEWFRYILSNMDTETKTVFCAAMAECGAGLSCAAYSIFELTVSEHDDTCSNIVGISGAFI